MMSAAPIFVVGLPRSGTTLLAAMLSAHPDIHCGPETFFFARLPRDTASLLDRSTWPGPALDYLLSLHMRQAPIHQLYGLDRPAMEADLADRLPSLAAMLESLTAAGARSAGKPRWAEKTPRHLATLGLVRAAFPDAAVVRVVRDPRDSALSLTRVPFASDSLVVNLDVCARADRAAAPVVRRDPRFLTVRFEDLVTDAESVLRDVCEFVEAPFDAGMLRPGAGALQLAASHEWWKGKESEPLDPSRVEVWRREMSADDQRVAAVVCSDMIERHGYPGAVKPRRTVVIERDAPGFVARDEAAVRRLALGGVVVRRRGAGGSAAGAVDLAFVAAAGRDPWRLGRSRRARVRALGRMASSLVRRRIRGRPATWVHAPGDQAANGATRLAELLLATLARPRTRDDWLATMTATSVEDAGRP